MHINFKANSNYLLLQFLFFHSLLFSYFKECTQITSVGNLQLLNAFQNQLYGPLLYLPILFWIFKRKHYYHFNIPSKRPSAIFFQGWISILPKVSTPILDLICFMIFCHQSFQTLFSRGKAVNKTTSNGVKT